MKKTKKYLLLLIIIIILSIIAIITEILITNLELKKFINNNNFKMEQYNIYTLEKNKNNILYTYQINYEDNFLTKSFTNENNNITENYNLYYKNNHEIIIEYQKLENNNNNIKIYAKKAKYKNNNLINCDILLGNEIKCDNLNNEVTIFNNEVEDILNEYNIKTNFILKNKNQKNQSNNNL